MKKTIKIGVYLMLLVNSFYAQDSLNGRLLSTTDTLVNAYALTVKDSIAYTGSNNFTILNISDINNPSVISSTSYGWFINSIFVDSTHAYLGGDKGLLILDISLLEEPKIVSFLETEYYIEEVEVDNNIAYLGTLDYAFLIIDVSDPANPFEISRVAHSDGYYIDDVWGIEIYDTLLFAASEDTGVKIFSTNDPANPLELGQANLFPNSTVVDMKLKDNVLFATHPRDLHAFDISDMSSPKELFYLEGAGGISIKIEGKYAYTASYDRVNVVDISNPNKLELVGYYPIPDVGSDIHVKNGLVQVACQLGGIYFIQFDIPTNIEKNVSNEIDCFLSQNYPNPFNPTTSINYTIKESGIVQVRVFNLLGEEIKVLVNKYQKAGYYNLVFDGVNIPSGVYFYKIIIGDFSETKKMLIIK